MFKELERIGKNEDCADLHGFVLDKTRGHNDKP